MFDHDYVEVNGIKLHVVSTGSGKTVLFLHGSPEFWCLWRHQLEEFVPNLRIERVEDGSHWLINEQPETVNAVMRGFLEGR